MRAVLISGGGAAKGPCPSPYTTVSPCEAYAQEDVRQHAASDSRAPRFAERVAQSRSDAPLVRASFYRETSQRARGVHARARP